jgi:hypothetical protein
MYDLHIIIANRLTGASHARKGMCMPGDWRVTNKVVTDGYMLGVLATGGLGLLMDPTYRYYLENEETGERRTVIASDADELGRKIEDGDFED